MYTFSLQKQAEFYLPGLFPLHTSVHRESVCTVLAASGHILYEKEKLGLLNYSNNKVN